ncbi:MerR family transcriptional regulator [Bdellovibrio bacteriovorus]|uniref:MerR family transcriptional regulator n=1 Tax=Bdellovibrio bacteriovorus TaxID=959 RepID=UPI0035A7313F
MEVFSIGIVAKMTGITEFTLRAWERRYGVPLPSRSDTGRRVYALREIEKLKILKLLTDNGHSIGEIAHLELSKLNALIKQSIANSATTQTVLRLIAATAECDLAKLSALLKTAQLENDTRTLLVEIISPTLAEIGRKVIDGELDVYHEHAASSVIRNLLSGILYSIEQLPDKNETKTIILATPEGEHHEFGVLISAILTALRGNKVLYLGPNMPATSLARAIRNVNAAVAVIGCSAPHEALSTSRYKEFVNQLSAEVDTSVPFWFGGFRNEDIDKLSCLTKRDVVFMNRYQDLERALRELSKSP